MKLSDQNNLEFRKAIYNALLQFVIDVFFKLDHKRRTKNLCYKQKIKLKIYTAKFYLI